MPTLFMLYRPDPTRRTLTFKLAKSGDAVVLIHEGVIATTHATEKDEIEDLMQRGVKVLALKEKNGAKGLGTTNGVENIEHDQLVDLLVKYDRVFS
jgi:sulfur relay protein TusB/DsrH